MDSHIKFKILSIKAQYRLHKQISIKLQESLDNRDPGILSSEALDHLLTQLGKSQSEWVSAVKIAKDWHLRRFLELIFKYYSPTLTKESGLGLDRWVQCQIDSHSYSLLDDCLVSFDPNYALTRFLKFENSL